MAIVVFWMGSHMLRLSRRLAVLGLLLAAVVAPAHAELSAVESRIVQAVKARSPAALALLERSVNGKRVLLLGHMGTVFEPSSPVAPWKPDGPRIRGQGVSDMKGGVVILLEALRALKSVGVLDGAAISVLLTGDEESVGQPGNPETRGAGDVQFAAPYAAGLDGLGATGGGAHSPLEYLHPESIEKNAIRAALMIHRLTR